jgi:hypothetical protein
MTPIRDLETETGSDTSAAQAGKRLIWQPGRAGPDLLPPEQERCRPIPSMAGTMRVLTEQTQFEGVERPSFADKSGSGSGPGFLPYAAAGWLVAVDRWRIQSGRIK